MERSSINISNRIEADEISEEELGEEEQFTPFFFFFSLFFFWSLFSFISAFVKNNKKERKLRRKMHSLFLFFTLFFVLSSFSFISSFAFICSFFKKNKRKWRRIMWRKRGWRRKVRSLILFRRSLLFLIHILLQVAVLQEKQGEEMKNNK